MPLAIIRFNFLSPEETYQAHYENNKLIYFSFKGIKY